MLLVLSLVFGQGRQVTLRPPSRQPTASCIPSGLQATERAIRSISTRRRFRRRELSHTPTCRRAGEEAAAATEEAGATRGRVRSAGLSIA